MLPRDKAVEASEPETLKPARGRAVVGLAIAACAVVAAGLWLTRASRPGRELEGDAPTRTVAATAPSTARNSAPQPKGSALPTLPPEAAALAQPASTASDGENSKPTPAAPAPPKRVRAVQEPKSNALAAAREKESGPSVRELLDEAASAFVLGQMPRARSIYQQVLDRQPAQADAWRGLGLTASRMGQRKDAERAFERYLQLRPNAPDAARIREQLDKVR
jgi:hypothetical protein